MEVGDGAGCREAHELDRDDGGQKLWEAQESTRDAAVHVPIPMDQATELIQTFVGVQLNSKRSLFLQFWRKALNKSDIFVTFWFLILAELLIRVTLAKNL